MKFLTAVSNFYQKGCPGSKIFMVKKNMNFYQDFINKKIGKSFFYQ